MTKKSSIKKFKITEDDGVVRVDKFLAQKLPEYSRAALHKLFKLELIKNSEGRFLKPGEKIRPGASFTADISPIDVIPDSIDMPIIYEDENVIVVDKPTGVISHARGRFWQEASVASFIRHRIKNPDGERAGIVHRLDRATSGVMICSKNQDTMRYLQKQFQDRKVVKTYIAAVSLPPKDVEAIIDAPIGRDPKEPKRFHVDSNGKHATTHYKVISSGKKATLLELEPKTGRTHQLRIHLNYIGRPIIGDELYSGAEADRLYLHANKLAIKLPTGEDKVFISEVPKSFYEI
jgi:23S rRNA pseudouridine1911/1915/1917 synthase